MGIGHERREYEADTGSVSPRRVQPQDPVGVMTFECAVVSGHLRPVIGTWDLEYRILSMAHSLDVVVMQEVSCAVDPEWNNLPWGRSAWGTYAMSGRVVLVYSDIPLDKRPEFCWRVLIHEIMHAFTGRYKPWMGPGSIGDELATGAFGSLAISLLLDPSPWLSPLLNRIGDHPGLPDFMNACISLPIENFATGSHVLETLVRQGNTFKR